MGSYTVYDGHSPWFRLHRHSEQYLRNLCIAATSLLCITVSFHGPNCMQTIHNNSDLVDTCRPFPQDCPTSLLQLATCNYISAVTHSTSLCVAFPVSLQQRKALKNSHVAFNNPITHTTPTGNILGTPELGTKFLFPMVSVIEGFHCTQYINAGAQEGLLKWSGCNRHAHVECRL